MTEQPQSISSANASAIRSQLRLDALYKTGILDSPPEKDFDRLTELTRRLLKVPIALVSLVDRDRQFFKSSQGLPEPWSCSRQTPLSLMLNLFSELKADGKTLLVCSHEWGEALNRYDRLLLLNRRLIADNTPQSSKPMVKLSSPLTADPQFPFLLKTHRRMTAIRFLEASGSKGG